MARKIILNMDPGVDDALALCLALADSRLDVVAVTATGGNVSPAQATRNVQTLVEQLDPPRWPRVGAALADQILRTDGQHLYGMDGFCGVHFEVAELHHRHPADKVLGDEIRSAPSELTVVSTGPLTNIAAVLQREPDLAPSIGHLIIVGGTLNGPGNVTPAAEFNFYCDAVSARHVLRSLVTKTLIPVDVSRQVVLGLDVLQKLPENGSRTGALLRKLLPGAFRSHHQQMGLEGIYVHAAVAVVAALHPELFRMERWHADVETEGELTHGATVLDRRPHAENRPNVDVAVEIDAPAVIDCILRSLSGAN